MSDTLKSWVAVGHHIVPADHAGRKIGGSTNPVRDYEEYAHLICRVDGKYQNDAANARLIAVSPDLLHMVKKLMAIIDDGISDPIDIDIYQQAKALLATLEGKPA